MKQIAILIFLLLLCVGVSAQVTTHNANRLHSGTTVPTMNCSPGPNYTDIYIRTTTGVHYTCTAAPNTWTPDGGGGSGTVTSVSVTTANGVSGSVATATTTPAISLTLGVITPSSVSTSGQIVSAQGTLAASTPAFSHTATWNNGAVVFTNIFSNITNSASDPTSLLIDLEMGGVSKFSVSTTGRVTTGAGIQASSTVVGGNLETAGYMAVGSTLMRSAAPGILTLSDYNETPLFGRINLGAATSSFPAVKRSATAVEFRLADDSASTSFVASTGILNAIGSDATHTDGTVCVDSGSGQLYKGSGTIGICLGTSSARYKHGIQQSDLGLARITKLKPISYFYNKGYGDDGSLRHLGFTAEDVAKVLPEVVGLDKDGRPNSVDMVALIPVLTNALQELNARVEKLERENRQNRQLKHRHFRK